LLQLPIIGGFLVLGCLKPAEIVAAGSIQAAPSLLETLHT